MDTTWDPQQYARFGKERLRPFIELLRRVPLAPDTVHRVIDLGCGPGTDMPVLRSFFPQAYLLGLDSSPEMIAAARSEGADPQAEYVLADVRTWAERPEEGPAPELIISNAMFQWVPGHLDLLPGIAERTAPGGVFALQVPGNFDAPSHVLLRRIAAQPEYAQFITEPLQDTVISAEQYLRVLSRPGWMADAWETTYLHVLAGEDAVFQWVCGTAARPVLNALPEEVRRSFEDEYRQALREAYPRTELGTVLPFRRIFAVVIREV